MLSLYDLERLKQFIDGGGVEARMVKGPLQGGNLTLVMEFRHTNRYDASVNSLPWSPEAVTPWVEWTPAAVGIWVPVRLSPVAEMFLQVARELEKKKSED